MDEKTQKHIFGTQMWDTLMVLKNIYDRRKNLFILASMENRERKASEGGGGGEDDGFKERMGTWLEENEE